MAGNGSRIRIRLRKSEIGGTTRQRQTLRGLGLRRIGDSREVEKTPEVVGMIKKVAHLLDVVEVLGVLDVLDVLDVEEAHVAD